jgi:hypothetical protein
MLCFYRTEIAYVMFHSSNFYLLNSKFKFSDWSVHCIELSNYTIGTWSSLRNRWCMIKLYFWNMMSNPLMTYLYCYIISLIYLAVRSIYGYYTGIFVLVFFVLWTLCCHFLWIAHFWWPLQYSLTCIQIIQCNCLTFEILISLWM